MKKFLLFILPFILLALFFISAGCTKEKSDKKIINLGDEFIIGLNETLYMNESVDKNIKSITFLNIIEDSRCAKDVQCIWQGRAIISLSIQTSNGSYYISISTMQNENNKKIGQYTIKFIELMPEKYAGKEIKKEGYKAKLIIYKD